MLTQYIKEIIEKDEYIKEASKDIKIESCIAYINIEYQDIRKFVKGLAEKDNRFILYNSGVNIKNMLSTYGYPFKSKQHSRGWNVYFNNVDETDKIIKYLNNNKDMLSDYEYIHNLPRGVKTNIKYIFGIREREREICMSIKSVPESLKYQFTKDFVNKKLILSDKCCYKLKKETAHKWEKENNKSIAITGIRADEGGMRSLNGCTIFDGKDLKKFHPLKVCSDEWEEWFIETYNIELCKLYYPPYNFKRTGCCGCPFALDLQNQLNVMEKLLPNDYKKAEMLWKPVYDEYRRLGYRLRKERTLWDLPYEITNKG